MQAVNLSELYAVEKAASIVKANYHAALALENLEVVVLTGDGNCLFRGISYCLYGDVARHAEVRKQVVDYMRDEVNGFSERFDQFKIGIDELEEFEEFKNQNVAVGGKTEFQAYLRFMGASQVWGSDMEVAAASELFNRQIIIYNYNPATQSVFYYPIDDSNHEIIRLDRSSPIHFDLIVESN